MMFEFSLVSPMLKMYIDSIAFSMKECLLLFHDIKYRRVWSTFFQNIRSFFSKYLFELFFFGLRTAKII